MYYCSHCHRAGHRSCCPVCGAQDLPQARPEDWCAVTELSEFWAGAVLTALKEWDIPARVEPIRGKELPFGRGKMHMLRIFVPYRHFGTAEWFVTELFCED